MVKASRKSATRSRKKTTSFRMRPIGDRVIIRRNKGMTQTPGGLILPETTTELEKPGVGEVLAVGPGKRLPDGGRESMEVSVGDIVFFPKFGGQIIGNDGGADLVACHESDIIAFEAK